VIRRRLCDRAAVVRGLLVGAAVTVVSLLFTHLQVQHVG